MFAVFQTVLFRNYNFMLDDTWKAVWLNTSEAPLIGTPQSTFLINE
jgi:hypothetical protein